MIFSSFTFLLLFMPIVLLLMRILPAKGKLPFLLAASLLFYGWGNPLWLPLLVYSILLNYMGGKCLGACCAHKKVILRHFCIFITPVDGLSVLSKVYCSQR